VGVQGAGGACGAELLADVHAEGVAQLRVGADQVAERPGDELAGPLLVLEGQRDQLDGSTLARVLAAASAASTGLERSGSSAAVDGRVYLGHQVGGLVQEHPRDAADQVRSLRRQGFPGVSHDCQRIGPLSNLPTGYGRVWADCRTKAAAPAVDVTGGHRTGRPQTIP
jgi:hypothetical protein